jgi:hypothetical protein
MIISELIEQFSKRTELPVDVNDVLACLKHGGIEGKIEFIGVEFKTEILQGQIRTFYGHNVAYGDPVLYVNIYYDRHADLSWQRMVCCKELIHLIDPAFAHTATPEQIRELAEKIGLPPEMQDPASDTLATNIDRIAEFRATAILFPWASRELLMPLYKSGEMSIEDIARLADIPRRYAGLVMSAGWEKVHALLMLAKR